MTDTCRHLNAPSTGHRVRNLSKGNGRADPRWAVYELLTCRDCGAKLHRQLGIVRAPDEREAARLCGVAPKDCEAIAAPARNSKAVEVPLTRWPFPGSTHFPKESHEQPPTEN